MCEGLNERGRQSGACEYAAALPDSQSRRRAGRASAVESPSARAADMHGAYRQLSRRVLTRNWAMNPGPAGKLAKAARGAESRSPDARRMAGATGAGRLSAPPATWCGMGYIIR